MQKKNGEPGKKDAFPIVGIGSSAGGLEALEQFMSHVPVDSGMAYVVIQHLDPNHEDILPELLQRITSLKVVRAKDRLKVEPNHVYVILPNKDMSILHGLLYLHAPSAPRGLRLPVDHFLRSLAEDQDDMAVGVILSGMGTDGTAGIRAIKEKAGLVLAQDPALAKFSGMPHSAASTGLVDIIAPADELPTRIQAIFKHLTLPPAKAGAETQPQDGMEKLLRLLRISSGQDFSLYKMSTVMRRVERRMGLHQLDNLAQYIQILQSNPQELELLFKELLIGVTGFFRDPQTWEVLKDALPALLKNHNPGETLRAWVPACSTGEEAYSLAMVFREVLEQTDAVGKYSLQIFASDLDWDAIDRARQGFFPANISADVSPERLSRFFVEEENGYRLSKEIREMVIFAPQNIIMDPPFTHLDILSCRNLLIYLETALQKKLVPLFYYSLVPGGLLFLGNAESIDGFIDLFTLMDNKARIFQRSEGSFPSEGVQFPVSYFPTTQNVQALPRSVKPVISLAALADQFILQTYSPAAALTNDKGDVLYINGHTGSYLEPAAGKANWNIFAMAREGLRYELISTFQRALHLKSTAISRGVKLESDGHTHFIDLTVQHIAQPEGLAGTLLVIFEPVETPAAISTVPVLKSGNTRAARIAELELELKKVRDELHITHEEMQTSQEELQSTNEELQSVNEELQSTNEELTTSKEELQSLNEELQTVNSELQSKVDDLSQANNDLKNLLNSTDVATVFLDGFFNVRRFTTQSTQVINLIPSDVGRPYTDITSALVYPEIIDDAREVLRSLVSIEKEISTRDQRWFGIRIMPYRTQDNRIDGVVMTFSDITTAKALEMELRARAQKAELLMDAMPVGLAVIDNQDKIARLNPAMEAILGVPQERLLMESESRLWKLLRPNGARLPVEELPGWRILHGQPAAPWIEVEATRADARAAHVQAGVVPYQQPEGGALLIVIELPALANASRGSNPT